MKELTGTAHLDVEAPLQSCYELLADVERYEDWYPDVVRRVDVLDREPDGLASRAHATLHVARGPLQHDFELMLSVERRPPRVVALVRVPNEPTDPEQFRVDWRLTGDGGRTRIGVELAALVDVPRVLPLRGIGDALAGGFVTAAGRALTGRT